jgi:N-acetylglucosamine malate deacetylase 1
MTVDIMAIGVHPDDIELGCAGTILHQARLGHSTAIVDLTEGELGTRGSAAARLIEARDAANILGVTHRDNMGFEDGFFSNDKAHQLELIKYIRLRKPSIILANAIYDRHPDHGRAAQLIADAAFLAGLSKIETTYNGQVQAAHRPRTVLHYVQSLDTHPQLAIDVTAYFETKIKSILAYKTQFYNPDHIGTDTFISSPEFLEFVRARASHYGVPIGVRYAEAYTVGRHVGVADLMAIY